MPDASPEPDLISVIYVSSARKQFQPDELRQLLCEIRESNKRRGITGMLLYRGGNFLQVIEGLKPEVDQLLKALYADPRHTGMTVLLQTKICKREFAQWEMAFRDVNQEEMSQFEGYSPFLQQSFTSPEFKSKLNACYKLLLRFKETLR